MMMLIDTALTEAAAGKASRLVGTTLGKAQGKNCNLIC